MQREDVVKQMKTLKAKARAARKAKNGAAANGFRAGARRLRRKLVKIPKPAAAKPAEEAAPAAAPAEA